jgi:hypothetical protein
LTSSPNQHGRPHFAAPLVIGVLADTHVFAQGSRRLPPEVGDLFARLRVGLILHAGDINTRSVLDELERVAPTLAVRGNGDEVALQTTLPEIIDLTIGRFACRLLHGHQQRTARATAQHHASGVDCVVYGHSHIPKIEQIGSTLLFNPGSPTDRRGQPHFSLGLLRVTDSAIEPELILFADPRHLANVL